MSRILLIDPPWYAFQGIKFCKPSYGLASLGAVLTKSGHSCIIYNGEFGLPGLPCSETVMASRVVLKVNLRDDSEIWRRTRDNIRRLIVDFQPGIVGLTIPTAKYAVAMRIAKDIKSWFPDKMIVAGGPHPTLLPFETIQEPSIDVVIKGEGEHIFVQLADMFHAGNGFAGVPGITFKKDSTIYDNPCPPLIENIDLLPFPDWSLIHQYKKFAPDLFGAIFSSRGCPYECIFCSSHKIWSRVVRFMSPERVADEVRYTSSRFKTKVFRFNDDTFTLNRERVLRICQLLKRIKISWMCEVRADLCDQEMLKTMKSAGCYQVNMGIESGNPEILSYTGKKISLRQIKQSAVLIRKAGLSLGAYFMFGFPNETIRQIKDTVNLMEELNVSHSYWSLATPYPGTSLYNEYIRYGGLPNYSCGEYFHHSPFMNISKQIKPDKLSWVASVIQKKVDEIKNKPKPKSGIRQIVAMLVSVLKRYFLLSKTVCDK